MSLVDLAVCWVRWGRAGVRAPLIPALLRAWVSNEANAVDIAGL